jgi:hypothetical protein
VTRWSTRECKICKQRKGREGNESCIKRVDAKKQRYMRGRGKYKYMVLEKMKEKRESCQHCTHAIYVF